MHIHYSPRSQYGFLVWIAEGIEDGRDSLYPFFNGKLIGCTGHFADALACLTEDIWVVVFLELLKLLLINTLWHEFFPRLIVYQRGEVVDGNLFIFIHQLCTVNQQRHTDADTTKYRDGITSLIAHSFQFVKSCLLFGCTFLLGLLFQTFFLLVLFIGEALVIDIDITRFRHSFCGANGFLQVIEILQLYIRQFQQLVIIKRTILEAALHNLFYLSLL